LTKRSDHVDERRGRRIEGDELVLVGEEIGKARERTGGGGASGLKRAAFLRRAAHGLKTSTKLNREEGNYLVLRRGKGEGGSEVDPTCEGRRDGS